MEANNILLNGATFSYFIIGPEDGPLIITLHGGRGFGSKSSDFAVYSKLAQYGYRVLSFDFRGHGDSSFTPPFTFSQIVDDIDALRNHFVGDKPCIICGGSFGGFLAQQYAITYPTNVSHLILRGTAASHHHEKEAFEVLESRLHKATNASLDMLSKVFSSFESDEEMRLVMFALAPLYAESYNPNNGLAGVLKTKYRAKSHNDLYSEQEKYFDYREKLPGLKIPTLIIVGDKDWICPPPQSQIIHELVPNSKLFVVPGANHSVHVEKSEIVLAEIRVFLGKSL